MRYLADELTRFQRTLAWMLGPRRGVGAVRRAAHGRARLPRRPRRTSSGCCAAQAMRAMRVVVDIGLHLELPIPDDERYHPRRDRGRPSSRCRSRSSAAMMPEDFMAQRGRPLPRVAGPGDQLQGRRARVAARARRGAARRLGDRFDLKAFHRHGVEPRQHGPRAARARARPVGARIAQRLVSKKHPTGALVTPKAQRRPAATAAASAAWSCCSTMSRPPSQKPGSARSTPTMPTQLLR